MKNTIELAAELIRRAAFVDAHALLKDECSVEYQEPSQAQYYALFKAMMTHIKYQESTSRLTVVGEEMAVGTIRQVWRTALEPYTTTLNERVSKASIKSREEFRKWSDDHILGFFEGLTAHPRILGLIDGMKKENSEFLSKDYMTFDAGGGCV